MPQLSLYLNEPTMKDLRNDAREAGVSVSKYVAQLVVEKASRKGWPDGYWDEVYGSLEDDSFQIPEELDAALDGALPSL